MATPPPPPSPPAPPQLQMVRPDLLGLPELRMPPGYLLRHFRDGDGPHWSAVYADAFDRPFEPELFDAIMRSDPAFRPERVWLVFSGEAPVATASAYVREQFMPAAGMIHFVGALRSLAGRRLGSTVTLAALRHMVVEGWNAAWLSTDDFRLPAIKVYLDLGFRPLVSDESHRSRWRSVFEKLGAPRLTQTWRPILDGPLYRPPAP